MPINWDTLSSVHFPEAKTVGSTQSSTSSPSGVNALSSLAGGVVKGMEAGADMRYKDSQTAGQNIINQNNQMILDNNKANATKAAELAKHNMDSEQNYLKVGQQLYGPQFVEGYKLTKAKTDTAVSQAEQATQKVKANSPAAQSGASAVFGSAADKAQEAQKFATNKFLQDNGVKFDAQTQQPVGQVPQPLMDKAHQVGLQAGQQMWSFKTTQMEAPLQQSLKDNNLLQWSDHVNTAMHIQAVSNIADNMKQGKVPAAVATAQRTAQLKVSIDKGTATEVEKNEYAALTNKGSSEPKSGGTLLTGTQGQKDFFNLRSLDRNLANGMVTLNTLSAQINSMPSSRMNPVTGKVNAQFDAQTEAVTKNLNTLVIQAPAIFGLPATALRAATVWNMVQKSKPSPELWTVANKAMIADLKYSAAIQAQKSWTDEAEAMKSQAASGNKQAVAESNNWFKTHPEPMKSTSKPDLTDFYKLFPGARGQLEQDWNTIAKTPLPQQQDQSNQSPNQQSPQQGQSQSSSKSWTYNPKTGQLE